MYQYKISAQEADDIKNKTAYNNKILSAFEEIDANRIVSNSEQGQALTRLESRLEALNKEKQAALEAFDIIYAKKLSEQISELTILIKQQKEKADIEERKNIFELKAKEKFNIALKYLQSLSKEDALYEANNNQIYKDQLGIYYNKLLEELEYD